MKKMILTFAAFCSISVAFAFPVPTAKLLERVIQVVEIMESSNNQVLMMKMDHLTRTQYATIAYEFTAGNTYNIVALGDENRISDIDLIVMNSNGTVLSKDTDLTNVAVASITPTTSGTYYFKVSPYSFKGSVNDGFFGLIISRAD